MFNWEFVSHTSVRNERVIDCCVKNGHYLLVFSRELTERRQTMTAVRLSSESVKSASECNRNVFWRFGFISEEAPVQLPEGFSCRVGAIGDVLSKLERRDLLGKEYLAEYLLDQHRRYCRCP
jgi:hypothetical protein